MNGIILNFWLVIILKASLIFAGKNRSLSVEKGSIVKTSLKVKGTFLNITLVIVFPGNQLVQGGQMY